MNDTNDPTDMWSVTPLKEELTGNLSYEFTFPVGDGTMGKMELGNQLSIKAMRHSGLRDR